MITAVAVLFSVHGVYYFMPHGEGSYLSILGICVFGMGHSLFSTCHSVVVRKIIVDEKKLPLCFSIISIVTELVEAICCYVSGWIKEKTGDF